jgi:hypothetical protein
LAVPLSAPVGLAYSVAARLAAPVKTTITIADLVGHWTTGRETREKAAGIVEFGGQFVVFHE